MAIATTSAIEAELTKVTKVRPAKNEPREKYLHRLWDAAYKLPEDDWNALSFPAATWANSITEEHRVWKTKKPNGEFSPSDFPDRATAKGPVEVPVEVEDEEEPPKAKKTKAKKPPVEEPEEPEEDEEEEATEEAPAAKVPPREPEEKDEPEEAPEDESEEDEPEEEVAKAKPKAKAKGKPKAKEPEPTKAEYDEPRMNVQGMVRMLMIENPHLDLTTLHQKISDETGAVVSLTTVRASHSWFRAALKDLQRYECLSQKFRAKLLQR